MPKCPHNRQKSKCKDCGGIGICHHLRVRTKCKECGYIPKLCPHNRKKAECKECGGSSICSHNRRKSQCKECKGSSICSHNRIKSQCYECGGSGCLESTFTGHLNTLINNTNTAQSDIYGNFTTLSYTQATGYETGEYNMGKIVATGTSYSAASGALDSLKTHFSTSGQTINQITATSSAVINVNNNSASYSNQASGYNDSLSAYWQGVTGFLDKRFYVNYSPQISGNYTGANTNFSCSETSIQINFDRNRLIYDTTGILNSQPSGENIHQFTAILESVCTGHETTLETSCLKFSEGQQRFGKIVFYPNHKNAWSGDLKAGSYNLKYVSGSFTTALAQHTLGSGTINAEKYV